MADRPLNAGDLRRLSSSRRRFLLLCWKLLVAWQGYLNLPKPFKMAVDTGLLTCLTFLIIPFGPSLPKSVPLFSWVGSFLLALIINLILPSDRKRVHWLRRDDEPYR